MPFEFGLNFAVLPCVHICIIILTDYISNLEICMALLQLLRIADVEVKNTICQQVSHVVIAPMVARLVQPIHYN